MGLNEPWATSGATNHRASDQGTSGATSPGTEEETSLGSSGGPVDPSDRSVGGSSGVERVPEAETVLVLYTRGSHLELVSSGRAALWVPDVADARQPDKPGEFAHHERPVQVDR